VPRLIIVADDYGYAAGYDEGILEVARAGAVDAVSAMVDRPGCAPGPLLETGVPVGLHLELDAVESSAGGGEVARQLAGFEELFGVPPTHLDGHRHSHARPEVALAVADAAAELVLPVRSVGPAHRRLLRARGVRTPDLLVGRTRAGEPALPAELEDGGSRLPPGVTEWLTHPGYSDPGSGSSYDEPREEDLRLLLGFRVAGGVARLAHREALRGS
jgi:predicted glycoside hydrolase/deacetylase ChbG (UPF0249 family)